MLSGRRRTVAPPCVEDPVTRRVALCFLALAPPLVLLSFVVPGLLPEVLFATVAVAFPVALIGLVTGRSGDRGSLAPWPIALLLRLVARTVGMLLLRGTGGGGPGRGPGSKGLFPFQ